MLGIRDWELLREQVEAVLGVSVTAAKLSTGEWDKLVEGSGTASSTDSIFSVEKDGKLYFLAAQEGSEAVIIHMPASAVSMKERKLVELAIESRKQERKILSPSSEEERRTALVREWFKGQQELGRTQAELPEAIISELSLYSTKVPLFIYGDQTTSRRVHYAEFKKLLESFFDTSILLIPMSDKEWLILGPENMLSIDAGDEKWSGSEDTVEEQLAALGHGLHEMLENEWVGESHLAVHYPMQPAKLLYSTILELREAITLGRTYRVGSNMHLPWELQLEKLIHTIPDSEKTAFLKRVLKSLDAALDNETMMTLEHFFAQDCSVSETAKKLYIHRNTLLYRLDKFRQVTGLDVRTFQHAVLVKIALLLYKVTKRK